MLACKVLRELSAKSIIVLVTAGEYATTSNGDDIELTCVLVQWITLFNTWW
jgi:hypothetical protein